MTAVATAAALLASDATVYAMAFVHLTAEPHPPAQHLQVALPLAACITGAGMSLGLAARTIRGEASQRATDAARAAGWIFGASLALLGAAGLAATYGAGVDPCGDGGPAPDGMDC
ncbi:MAG: hypothetical protein KF729_37260 [Sandaracinaceae bacterium]|nr:hypothetical protein [Sandaracinaceae bacterium]